MAAESSGAMHRVVRWEIAANDLKAVRDFYAQLFGWGAASTNPARYALIDAAGGIGGVIFRADSGMPTFVTFYVEVPSVEDALRRAEDLGGTVYVPPTASPVPGEEVFGVFGDPEGNVVGVAQRRRATG